MAEVHTDEKLIDVTHIERHNVSDNMVSSTTLHTLGNISHANLVFTDETNIDWRNSRKTLKVPCSNTILQLYESISLETGYAVDTFDLVWRCQNNSDGEQEIILDRLSTMTIVDFGMSEQIYLLIRGRTVEEQVADSSSSDSSKIVSCSSTSDAGFVGLVNQAMTCYLNSLLQTLYMTPEFRNSLYKWKFEIAEDGHKEKDAVKCIPYQLQRLFILLQTSSKRSIETTDITTSFGWNSGDAWQQHDVQELCRVMFDALEKQFKKDHERTSVINENLINELYQGTWIDYVKCTQCSYESAREDTFLDIPLVIKPFGSDLAFKSVEEALLSFVEPENLEGDNQYFCERCKKKQDACKGLRFKKFPYLLTLQLKRFDFDYSTMNRIKLNDRVSFPKLLNLNSFVEDNRKQPHTNLDLYKNFVVDMFEATKQSSITNVCDDNLQPSNGSSVVNFLHEGPYVYELFSIMIHSGSAIGGHYYVYIKTLHTKEWYCFNDQVVSKISQENIEESFGGNERGYHSSIYSSSANAYMLMYRQIDIDKNEDFFDVKDFLHQCPHIHRQVQIELEKELLLKQKQELDKQMCKFKLFSVDLSSKKVKEKRLEVHQSTPFQDALEQAYNIMELSPHIPVEQCRLVKYDDYSETLDQSLDLIELSGLTFGQVVGGARSYYSFELFLETRGKNQQFVKYNKGGMNLKLMVVDLQKNDVFFSCNIRAEQSWSVKSLKNFIGELLHMDPSCMNVVLEMYNDGRHLSSDESTLRGEGLYRKHTLFVCSDATDFQKPFKQSLMNAIVEQYVNSILLNITLPPQQHMDNSVTFDRSNGTQNSSLSTNNCLDVTGKKRDIQMRVDRRTTLAELKEKLEPFVGVPSVNFKLYRVYSNHQEYELERLNDTLMSTPPESKLVVRLGRALLPGEHRIKIYQLKPNDTEFYSFMFESIVSKNTTIKDFKIQIKNEATIQGVDLTLPVERMRLRKKTWRSPGSIYFDHQIIDRDLFVYPGTEMYIEVLPVPEKMRLPSQMQVYVRRWHPSKFTVDLTDEIILDSAYVAELKEKLSVLSNIPLEYISIAKGVGSFPAFISAFEIENELDWNPAVAAINQSPFCMYDDGGVIFFKDSREKVPELTKEKKLEIQKAEQARLNVPGTSSSQSSYTYLRKEKPLKIYTDDEKSNNGSED